MALNAGFQRSPERLRPTITSWRSTNRTRSRHDSPFVTCVPGTLKKTGRNDQRSSSTVRARPPRARFDIVEPAAPQFFDRDARQIRFDVQNCRAVEHVDAADGQPATVATEQPDDTEADWIRAARRTRREHTMRPRVDGRRSEKL